MWGLDAGVATVIASAIAAVAAVACGAIAAVASVRALRQTRPNGGSSMRDSLNQLHEKLDGHVQSSNTRLDAIEGYLTSPTHDRELVGGRDTSARFPLTRIH
jgi:hypothetical protein